MLTEIDKFLSIILIHKSIQTKVFMLVIWNVLGDELNIRPMHKAIFAAKDWISRL